MKKLYLEASILIIVVSTVFLIANNFPLTGKVTNPQIQSACSVSGFVSASGNQLVLNGESYKFIGADVHSIGKASDDEIRRILNYLSNTCGANAIRIWGFKNTFGIGGIGNVRRVLDIGAGYNVKFIIALEDFPYGPPESNPREWFTNGYRTEYKPYVQQIVNEFRNRQEILAWEIMNEPHCKGDEACVSAFYAFVDDIAKTIKSIDTNHIVSIGTMGLNHVGERISNGEYQNIHSIPEVGIASGHYNDEDATQKNYMYSDIGIADSIGKPFYIGESWIKGHGPGDQGSCTSSGCTNVCGTTELQNRAQRYSNEMNDMFSRGADGYLIWQYSPVGNPALSCDPFSFFDGDPICGIMKAKSDEICRAEPPRTGSISGRVTDRDTGNSISGASVAISGRSATTGADGSYTITDVPIGTYTASASASGYISANIPDVPVSYGQTTPNINFELEPVSPTEACTEDCGYIDSSGNNDRICINYGSSGDRYVCSTNAGYGTIKNACDRFDALCFQNSYFSTWSECDALGDGSEKSGSNGITDPKGTRHNVNGNDIICMPVNNYYESWVQCGGSLQGDGVLKQQGETISDGTTTYYCCNNRWQATDCSVVVAVCGDGNCDTSENSITCPQDCPVCRACGESCLSTGYSIGICSPSLQCITVKPYVDSRKCCVDKDCQLGKICLQGECTTYACQNLVGRFQLDTNRNGQPDGGDGPWEQNLQIMLGEKANIGMIDTSSSSYPSATLEVTGPGFTQTFSSNPANFQPPAAGTYTLSATSGSCTVQATLTVSGTGPPPPPQPGASSLIYGLAGHWFFTYDPPNVDNVDRFVNFYRDLGATNIRLGIDWAQVEPTEGNYDWAKFDRILNAFNSNGIRIIGVFVTVPPWASENPSECSSSQIRCRIRRDKENRFIAATQAMVQRYPYIQHWEFWNEPEMWDGLRNANDYQFWLTKFYDTVKSVDSGKKVAASSLTGWDFLGQIYDSGKFDALATHPYSQRGASCSGVSQSIDRSKVERMRNEMVARGGSNKKIWLTEYGWNSVPNGCMPQNDQAQFLRDALTWIQSKDYIEVANIHMLHDWSNSGGREGYGLVTEAFAHKPAYAAFRDIATAAQRCSDGTARNSCSSTRPRYCDSNGNLVDNYCYGPDRVAGNSDDCGCASGTCQSDGSCRLCNPGEIRSGTTCLVCNAQGTGYNQDSSRCPSGQTCQADGSCRPYALKRCSEADASTATKIDYVMLPDQSYATIDEFKNDIQNRYLSQFFAINPLGSNRQKFNVYYYEEKATCNRDGPNGIKLCDLPSNLARDCPFADIKAVIHKGGWRDYSSNQFFTANNPMTQVHEMGHALFDLADEYCCDGGYFDLNRYPYPNIFNNQNLCQTQLNDNSISKQCKKICDDEDQGSPSCGSNCQCVNWYRQEGNSIMNTQWLTDRFSDNNLLRINWLFSNWPA